MKWPWPTDSREDRAKRVALSYRHLVESLATGHVTDAEQALRALDERWSGLGAGWVQPTFAPLNLDEWLRAAQMADLFHQDAKTVRNWGRRGNIRVQVFAGVQHYNVGDVVAYQRRRRLRRAHVDTRATLRSGQTLP